MPSAFTAEGILHQSCSASTEDWPVQAGLAGQFCASTRRTRSPLYGCDGKRQERGATGALRCA